MNALVKAVPQPVDAAPTTGAALYRVSTDAAQLCREIVLATASNIQGRRYVQVEGWQAIALAHGCVASSGDVVREPDGGFRATGKVARMDTGVILATAEGYVGPDEPTWFGGVVTSKYGTKTLPKRPDYAIRAMAQTRAISRACRSAFAHVVVMMNANLQTTPAEEVPDGGFDDAPHYAQPQRQETQTKKEDQKPPRKTFAQFASDLEAELSKCITSDDVDDIISRNDVKKVLAVAVNGSLKQLEAIIRAAKDRTTPPADEQDAA